MDKESRKLQQVGGSTLTVSLPKDWVDRRGLEAGDAVVFEPSGAGLTIEPLETADDEETVCRIDAGSCDTELVGRCIVGGYILGYETLVVEDAGGLSREQLNTVHRTMRQLNGISIVDQDDEHVRLRNFIDVSDSSIDVIIRRLSTTVLHMLDSTLYALLQHRDDLLEEVEEMEDEVDVLYWLLLRQLLSAADDEAVQDDIGIGSPLHIVGDRTAIKAMEGMADCLQDIGTIVEELNAEDIELTGRQEELLAELSEFVHARIEDAVEGLLDQDIEQANAVIETADGFTELADRFLADADGDVRLHKLVWNLERVVEYSSFIAEIGVNRSLETDSDVTELESI